jgi:hypothetical protein
LAKRLLKSVLRDHDFSAVVGDFEEMFQYLAVDEGLTQARRWYWRHVLVSLPGLIWKYFCWSGAMFQNYLKATLRNLLRHKSFSLINISGLAIGMACCLLLLFWVKDELSFDRHHEHADDLYRVVNHSEKENTSYLVTPGGLGPALLQEVPEVVNTMRSAPNQRRLIQYRENRFYEDDVFLADPSLFEMFTFTFLAGDPASCLTSSEAVVLTDSLALKYFGPEDPMGKTLKINNSDCVVTAVIADIPHNSHFRFTLVRSFEIIPEHLKKWDGIQWNTYVQLRTGARGEEVNPKVTACVRRHMPGSDSRYELQPLREVRLFSSHFQYDSALRGNIKYVYIFSALAICILLIACINFMNLATARSGNRAKEVGLRKVVGARRLDLIRQFLGESVFLTGIALAAALFLVVISLPLFNRIAGKNIQLGFQGMGEVWLLFLAVALVTGLVSGSYPALFLSAFQPTSIFRGGPDTGSGRAVLRKSLVIVQFSLTVFLIIGTFVIYSQLQFMQNRALGFEREQIVYMPMYGQLREKYQTIKTRLLQSSTIADVTTSYVPVGIGSGCYGEWDGKEPEDEVHMYMASVDYNFLDFFDIDLVAGRFFSPEFSTDSAQAFVVNEAAARAMKMKDPIGERFAFGGGGMSGRIIGVIKDFHYRSLHNQIEPFIFILLPEEYWQLIVKFKAGQISAGLAYLEEVWIDFIPGFPPDFAFLDATLEERYQDEKRLGILFRCFTGLAVLIACLGLFGLASFLAEQRTKEIGIRKVLGASRFSIVKMMTREFNLWVIAANVLAWPAAYFAMNNWLRGFAYRTTIPAWIFPAAALLSISIALLTSSYQSFKAARTDPVKSLRFE